MSKLSVKNQKEVKKVHKQNLWNVLRSSESNKAVEQPEKAESLFHTQKLWSKTHMTVQTNFTIDKIKKLCRHTDVLTYRHHCENYWHQTKDNHHDGFCSVTQEQHGRIF